jgi:hypothetical protein
VVCIFLLLGFIVTLGIDEDNVVCRCSRCLQSRKGEDVFEEKVGVHHIEIWF